MQSSACGLPQTRLSNLCFFCLFVFLLLLFLIVSLAFSLSCSFCLFPPLLFFCCISLTFPHNFFHLYATVSDLLVPTQLHPTTPLQTHTNTVFQPGTSGSNKSCSLWIPWPVQVWGEHAWTPGTSRMARRSQTPNSPNPLSSRSPPPQVTHAEELSPWDLPGES